MKITIILCMISLSVYASRSWAQQESAWALSANPVSISYVPKDSAMEAGLSYLIHQAALPASDQPDQTQTYRAYVSGNRKLDLLWLAGGINWSQSLLEGRKWNLLSQPDYLITAGDSLGEPQRIEKYRIYGQAAYVLSPKIKVGIDGDYTATSNEDRSSYHIYHGMAHLIRISGGIVYEQVRRRFGASIHYTHRTEELTYDTDSKDKLYTFPLGYWLPMQELSGSFLFRSQGKRLGVSLQTETLKEHWSLFHDLSYETQQLADNPNNSGNLRGWEERLHQICYQGRFTRTNKSWTHIWSPTARFNQTTANRILQRNPTTSSSAIWTTFATYRLARQRMLSTQLSYEATKNDTSGGKASTWQMTVGWNRLENDFYIYPFTVKQYTGLFHGEIAFFRQIRLPKENKLSIRQSVYIVSGYGTEIKWEKETQKDENGSAEIKLEQNMQKVNEDFIARTATRLGIGTEMEYRHPIHSALSAGFRLKGSLEQTTSPQSTLGGGGNFSIVIWL